MASSVVYLFSTVNERVTNLVVMLAFLPGPPLIYLLYDHALTVNLENASCMEGAVECGQILIPFGTAFSFTQPFLTNSDG